MIGLFLSFASYGWAQEYQNGARKGMIKVKFSPAISASLSNMQVSARRNQLTTGIEAFDKVAQSTSATNLYRLFPYDAKNENKLRKHGLHLWYIVEIDKDVDPKTAVAKFKQLKEVAVAEVEREKSIAPFTVTNHNDNTSTNAALPFNDPLLKDQWHYENTGQTGYSGADINLFEAWTKTGGANNIVVSVHDQGVDVNHPDLKANIWTNPAELNGIPNVDDDGNGYIDDVHGYNFEKNKGAVDAQFHGTHVAGTIAAVNNNGIGVSGVAGGTGNGDGVRIMSMQILGGAAIEKSYVYAADNGAVISQNSWGYTTPGFVDQSVIDAINYFIAEAGNYPGSPMKGGIVIFAAGNNNEDKIYYPGYHPNVMAVGALGPEWKKAAYSNFGQWIEISAPGGDVAYGSKNGVLSTIPDNQYAYIQGTSMACPHVSGVAALALANRTKQLTNEELWNKLLTGVVDVDQYNENYKGKLGVGAIDAALSILNDQVIAPQAIVDLSITGIAQEFATLKWTVPADADDKQPVAFTVYFHTQPITTNNLHAATKALVKSTVAAGTNFSYEVNGLLGLTTYYFAVTATDRWGNISVISNIVSDTTNEGPSIAVDENSSEINLMIDAVTSTTATHDITVRNGATGVLRWNHFMRHVSNYGTFNAAALNYPKAAPKKAGDERVVMRRALDAAVKLRSNEPVPTAFTPIDKMLSEQATNIIGEVDTTLTNSAGARFYVSEADGFNLTHLQMYLKHDPGKGPVIVEVYKGTSPAKKDLVHAQEFSSWSTDEGWAFIPLNEQLYFESGSTFWVVFHIPAGNIFPLGIGLEANPAASGNCFMSFDLGASWSPLEELLDSKDYAWAMVASSSNPYLGTYLTLEPGSGDINGESEILTTLTASAATLVNGSYSANLVLASNDALQQELRIPVNLTVTGHKPDIKHISIADFGSVFMGASKTLEVVLDNHGYGNLNDILFSITDPQFSIENGEPWQISARSQEIIKIKFAPTSTGSTNSTLKFTNGAHTYEIALFGVGTETSKIAITPESQTIGKLTLGSEVLANINVENKGAYPLKYFIPGHDTKGISDNWPTKYHYYGYKLRTNYATESNPLAYTFQDISSSGTNITEPLKQQKWYHEVDMGFDFPYYGEKMKKIYIAKLGFTTFDNSVNPLNTPVLNNNYSPKGYISVLGTFIDYKSQGDVFYKVEIDRVIIQYNNVTDGISGESITAQMVLYANGDIRFFYDVMGFSEWNQQYLNILIEDIGRKDGIMVHEYHHPIQLYDKLALGFDYPGPNIITSVENGSGLIMPGNSAVVKVKLSTVSLYEGTITRSINFISNDPSNSQANALIHLQITKGGVAKPVVSTDTIDFGDVFQNAVRSAFFTVKNEGTEPLDIRNARLANNLFTLVGGGRTFVNPGQYTKYQVTIPTNKLGKREDVITIRYATGPADQIIIKGNVIDAPAITVDLSVLQETLAYGETATHPLTIENKGKANLEFVGIGKQWLSFDVPVAPSSGQLPEFTYAYEKYNNGVPYQWIDIRKTGTQMPFAKDVFNKNDYWRNLTLPFSVQFYGQTFSKLKIGENGIISFDEDPDNMYFEDHLPTNVAGSFIMPYWTFGGFNTTVFPKEDVGIFYQFYDDKIIITWSHLINNFGGMGDPISAQVVLYKNGTMKFQYKVEDLGSDQTSNFTAIGVQQSPTSSVLISDHNSLDHGNGLAYVLVPAKKYIVAPASSITGQITLDAQNIYGGQYNETLKIQTNVPGSELLLKPVELTVTGEASLVKSDTIDFGKKMVGFEYGYPIVNFKDIEIANNGSAALEITSAQMADGTKGLSMAVWMLADGWIDQEWRWVDIAEIFSPWAEPTVLKLLPGDRLDAKVIFYPAEEGEFTDELVLTTSIGERRIVLEGTAVERPAIKVTTTPISVVMNTPSETAVRNIKFNNLKGKSDLEYNVSIDYGRISTNVNTESIAATATPNNLLSARNAEISSEGGAKATAAYNRTIRHSDKEVAEGGIGLGGGVPFTVATKFNAGPDGFNLSHIETWFTAEKVKEGTIRAEIRAGGTNIVNAVKVASATHDFTASGSDVKGSWHQIKMDAPAALYPNETFYVVVTYPLGIERPQGTLKNEEYTPGRYYYFDGDFWNDIQEVPSAGFNTLALLMYAAEETANNAAWLKITSATKGVLAKGDTSSVSIKMEGSIATRGDQLAKVVITSNDPLLPTVHVPVSLHMNEAPFFINPPVNIQMAENETITLNIGVGDTEGHTVTIKGVETYEGVTHTFASGKLSVAISKDYGDAGNYNYRFIATDQYDASREIVLSVEVVHTNRAPEFVGSENLTYYSTGTLEEYSIEDFFSDPDDDDFTFSVTSSNSALVDVFASKGQFLVKPISAGQAYLAFTAIDSYGAISRDTIAVTVNNIMGVDEEANAGVKVYPNPVQKIAQVILSNEWKGVVSIEIIDASGRQYVSQNTNAADSRDIQIDVSVLPKGFYILRATSSEKQKSIKLIKD